ncbi:hypothetical protein [Treponema zioleckii]|uniref:hypothetical protein n=1 Tax=Treponema zioleckii TaxID=331680 RepID=UPI00168AE9B0|nr:hypothetical protein [Treponema zioleckii]
MKKKLLFVFAMAILVSVAAFAQSSEKLTEIISTENVTCGQVAYLAATYSSAISEDDGDEKAFELYKEEGCFGPSVLASDAATLAEVSNLLVKVTNTKCGLFYRLTGAQRYAFKELKAKGIIPQTADPNMKISGRDAIGILNKLISE